MPASIIDHLRRRRAQGVPELARQPGASCSSPRCSTIYVLLGILYESYIHPLTILAGLPSAAVGALLTLRLFGMDLTLIAMIGILMLIGIVKKNAIMMIDFALDAQRDGRACAGRRDPRGVPAALPADHDDDAGGADGRAADRARPGRRRRAAPAARPRRGRRAARLAAADALHHAGDLPLHGPALDRDDPARAAPARQERALAGGPSAPSPSRSPRSGRRRSRIAGSVGPPLVLSGKQAAIGMLFVNAIPAGRTGFVPLVFDKASWLQVIREDDQITIGRNLGRNGAEPSNFLESS